MNKKLFFLTFAVIAASANAKDYKVTSPDKRTEVTVTDGNELFFSIAHNGQTMLSPSAISLQMADGSAIGKGAVKKQGARTGVKEHITAPLYRQKSFDVDYNEMTLATQAGDIVFRAYNEGVAYRFVTKAGGNIIVRNERADYSFPQDFTAYLPYSTNEKKPFAMAFQARYDATPLSKAQDIPAFLPVTIDEGNGLKLTITEADLENYPGMFLQKAEPALVSLAKGPQNTNTATGYRSAKGRMQPAKAAATALPMLKGVFAPYPKTTAYYPWRKQLYVTSGEDYIAKIDGRSNLPWRVFAITEHDTDMPTNNLVYALASPNRIGDTGWIKPGKVSWDWWNDWGLTGVGFKAGIDTRTYKYFIDFASAHGIEYIVLDEGWYLPKSGDMLTTIPDIDLPELIKYGKEKGVGIVLWTVFNVLDDQLETACSKYAQMGIKGFKVDFLDRDDQTAVQMAYRIAAACAKHHLMLDYHGFYKPTGMNRTYPNLVNIESVFGMEEAKWSPKDIDMPQYDVTFPYIRMMAGHVDFTPGAMRNATKSDFQPVYSHPFSMGTRCHQAAMYVVFDSPLTMLADAPTEYQKEEPYTHFLCSLPTVYDATRILQGVMGQYIVTARRLGDAWYVGGLTNWNSRTVDLSFDFLAPGKTYKATICHDGPNADHSATDYVLRTLTVKNTDKLPVYLASGGGFAMTVEPE